MFTLLGKLLNRKVYANILQIAIIKLFPKAYDNGRSSQNAILYLSKYKEIIEYPNTTYLVGGGKWKSIAVKILCLQTKLLNTQIKQMFYVEEGVAK